jgi:hypothetical protein
MDNDLIDQQILELLRTPVTNRTQLHVASALARIAEAAQLIQASRPDDFGTQPYLFELQREQLKLAAIADFLGEELNFKHCDTQLNIRESGLTWHTALTVLFTNPNSQAGDPFLIGHGNTAEEALRDLHTMIKGGRAA